MGEENDEPGEDGQQLRDWNCPQVYLGICIFGCDYILVYVGIFMALKHAYVS